jgi:hypothetical protein
MNYIIAVFADRIQAEAAYTALESEGLPTSQVAILGAGYKTAEEFGFLDPNQQARKQARLMAFWLVPFGFIGGVAFNLSTQINLIESLGRVGNEILGGIFGAIAGAMGSFFIGGSLGLTGSNTDALSYSEYLSKGKYLVVVSGAPNITNQAMRILKQLRPENLQGYVDPTR